MVLLVRGVAVRRSVVVVNHFVLLLLVLELMNGLELSSLVVGRELVVSFLMVDWFMMRNIVVGRTGNVVIVVMSVKAVVFDLWCQVMWHARTHWMELWLLDRCKYFGGFGWDGASWLFAGWSHWDLIKVELLVLGVIMVGHCLKNVMLMEVYWLNVVLVIVVVVELVMSLVISSRNWLKMMSLILCLHLFLLRLLGRWLRILLS